MTIAVGQVASVSRAFTQDDFDRFAALSGDDNPIHVDPAFAARSKFGRTVAHGMLLYSAVSTTLSSRWPHLGCKQLVQELKFPAPTYAEQAVEIRLEIVSVLYREGLAELSTEVVQPGGQRGLKGSMLVRLPGSSKFQLRTAETADQPEQPAGEPFKGFAVGQKAVLQRTFSAENLTDYVDLAGERCPVFNDTDMARQAGFADSPIPGALLGGLFSTLLGTRLPGAGTNYLKQRLEFPAPAYPNQELTAEVEIVRIRPDKQLVNLATRCTTAAGLTVCEGEALVLISDVS
ncbi:MAG: MaoC family dehydratase [Caldilineales bacterium]